MRKTKFDKGEFYHIFNRGTDKRKIFLDQNDQRRFFQSMCEFNTLNPIGSIYEKTYLNKIALGGRASKKVMSSWGEYVGENMHGFCDKYKVLGQFRSWEEYEEFAESTLQGILERKEILKEMEE